MTPDGAISVLLNRLASENIDSDLTRAQVFEVAYEELHKIANSLMRRERGNHTLQPTALVNEAYLRLVGDDATDWESRAHFFGVAVRAMRQLLVHHARSKNAEKRGGDRRQVTLVSNAAVADGAHLDVLGLDQALTRLTTLDERMSRIVELRFFGGLSTDEIAAVLGTSRRTVQRDWTVAKRWLSNELSEDDELD